VLIVDDDERTVETFAQWLVALGYETATACDGEGALRLLSNVDAVIVDARMPVIDGFEFLRRARVRYPHLPAAIVTGDYLLDDATVSECQQLEATLVFKPVWLDTLESLAEQLIHRTRVI
jgi:CheY-like chemotaxis protein